MKDILIVLIIIAIVGGASFYIVRAKKKGQKCIGCPCSSNGKCKCKK